MANPITTNGGTEEIILAVGPQREAVISVQGSNDAFTWSIEKSLDNGTTWGAMKDAAGTSVFTGLNDFRIKAASDARYRVKVVALNSATWVLVRVG